MSYTLAPDDDPFDPDIDDADEEDDEETEDGDQDDDDEEEEGTWRVQVLASLDFVRLNFL